MLVAAGKVATIQLIVTIVMFNTRSLDNPSRVVSSHLRLSRMSVPRFFAPDLPLQGTVDLEDSEARHASSVLRLAVGASIELFDGLGGEAQAVISHLAKRCVRADIVRRTDTNREAPRPLELLVSLPKGDRQRTLIDGLVQFGVAQLTPLIASRSVAQPTGSALERLERMVIESSKQCGRNQLLHIHAPVTVAQLAVPVSDHERRFRCLAHPGSPTSLHQLQSLISPYAGACCAIGPEGGFTDDEVAELTRAGWLAVDLGARLLRVEFAALCLAACWSGFPTAPPTTSER